MRTIHTSNSLRVDHLGPVSTYMTSCNGDCTQFDVTGAQWFKVDASGYDNGVWASAQLISSQSNGHIHDTLKLKHLLDNDSWTSTIPADLAPGQYVGLSIDEYLVFFSDNHLL